MKSKWFKRLLALTLSVLLASCLTLAFAEPADPTPQKATPIASMFYIDGKTQTYDGITKSVTVRASVRNIDYIADITYEGDHVNAGTCKVTAIVMVSENDYFNAGTVTLTGTLTINPCGFSISVPDLTYSGQAQAPSVTVTANGKTLTKDMDYTVSAKSYTNAGSGYQVTVTGKGNYTGTQTATYAINPSSDLNVSLSASEFTYNTKTQVPSVTVTGVSGTLKKGTDYTLTYSNESSKDAGSYSVTVTGTGNYTGTKTFPYTIKPSSDLTVTLSKTAYTYNGKEQKPTVTVKGVGGTLKEGTDYSVTWPADMTNAGSKPVTVTGIGNYTGTVTTSYTIDPITTALTVQLSQSSFVYNAQSQKPALTLTCAGFTLTEGVDYTVAWPADTTNASTKSITVTGKGNFTGSGSTSYVITPKSDPVVILLSQDQFTYNGQEQRPVITKITCGDLTLSAADYTLTLPTESVNATTYTISAATSSNFVNNGSVSYRIAPNPGPLEVTLDQNSFIYNGAVQQPTITSVKVGNLSLTANQDYTLSMPSSINGSATYTLNLTGIGNFSGAGSATYTIDPFDLKNATLNLAYTATYYTSKVQQPAADMTYPGEGSVAFTTAYSSGCKLVGTYTVTVTGVAPNFTGTSSTTYTIQWLPTPATPITLVGKLNTDNGWYYDDPVQITPASGYTIGYGIEASALNNPYLTMADGTDLTGTVHLMNARGEITDGVTIPTFKQDTQPPSFTVSMSGSSPLITARAQDKLSGAVIIFKSGSTAEEIHIPLNKALTDPVTLKKLQTRAATYTVVIVDEAGNYSYAADTYSRYFGDSDGDGLIDAYERYWGSDPHVADTDGDGLDDGKEYNLGTDPKLSDTDGDGVNDGDEVLIYNTDPTKADSNNDGIDDYVSILAENYFGRSKTSPTALNMLLGNRLDRVAPAFEGDALIAALNTLADNGYLTTLTVDPYTATKRQVVARGSEQVKVSKGAEMVMVKADTATNTLWGLHESTGLLMSFSVTSQGRLDAQNAINLCELFGVDTLSGLSVMTDASASIFVIGNWDMAANCAASDLIVFIPGAQAAWTISDSANCTRFEVAPDGSKIAYVIGSTVSVLDLTTGNPLGAMTASCQMLGFTADSKVITALNGHVATVCTVNSDMALSAAQEDFYGLYYDQQPTMKAVSMKLLVAAGSSDLVTEDTTLDLDSTGYATARGTLSSLAFQMDGKKTSTAYAKYFQQN